MEKKKMATVIAMIGIERCDLMYFLSSKIQNIAYECKILLIDNSISGDLFYIANNPDEADSGMIKDMPIVRGKRVDAAALEFYDYIFIYNGLKVANKDWLFENSNIVIIMTDYLPTTITKIKKFEVSNIPDENLHIIFRDKCTPKISEKAILSEIEVETTNCSVLPYDSKDYAAYTTLQYNGTHPFKVSSEFTELVKGLIIEITGLSEKEVKKLLKK